MGFIGRLKFNRRFFAGLLVVLVVFGVFGGGFAGLENAYAEKGGYWEQLMTTYRNDGWAGLLGAQEEDSYGMTNKVGVYGVGNGEYDTEELGIGAWLIQKSSELVMWTVSSELYDDVFFSAGAKRALSFIWGVVRDFVNMFYLLILIFLAITTILRVNKFSDKKLFFNVIVSAILVNFSLPITLVVIDFSNVLMDFFAQAIKDTLHNQDIGTFFLNHSHYAGSFSWDDLIKGTVASIVQFVIEIAMAVMLLFTAVSLLVRLVAYWVLIILSPLAFFSIALPGSGSFQEWKDKLLNYSFYGPMMLFFIWIALLLLAELGAVLSQSKQSDPFMTFLVSYITVMYLLYYGHDKSKSMAAKAGDTVSMLMKKGGDYAVKAGKNVGTLGMAPLVESHAKAQYTGIKSKMMQNDLARQIFKEGREQKQKEREQIATAAWESGGLNPFGGKRKDAKKHAKDSIEVRRMKEKEKAMEEAGFDWENRDKVINLAENGSGIEKKIANIKRAEKGWAGGKDDAKNVISALGGNKQLKDQAIREMKKNGNEYSVMNYYLSLDDDNQEKQDYMKDAIKSMMLASKDDKYDNDGATKDQSIRSQFIREYFGNRREDAMMAGILFGKKNINDTAKFLNEDAEVARNVMANRDGRFGLNNKFPKPKQKELLHTNLKGQIQQILAPSLVGGGGSGNTASANTTASGIYTGSGRQSSARSNPQRGNFNGVG